MRELPMRAFHVFPLAASLAAGLALAGCAPTAVQAGGPAADPGPEAAAPRPAGVALVARAGEGEERPLPYPVVSPPEYRRAVERGTRSPSGAPGPRYWQQWTRYRLDARVDPAGKRLEGQGRIVYRNASPDTLAVLYLHLIQNVHAPGAVRNEPYEVTGGVELRRLSAGGRTLAPDAPGREAGYRIDGTVLEAVLPRPLLPGDSVALEVEWAFAIPRQGAGGRMGWDSEDLLFLAYWYPQLAVYDDVVGWHTDPFLGAAEFHAGFAAYDVTVRAPAGWVVRGTGRLANPEAVLAPEVLRRLRQAEAADTVVRVMGAVDGAGPGATVPGPGALEWRFRADTARDFAFSLTRGALWDAVRAPVGDRDGDGRTDYTRVEALYRPSAPLWREVARYGRHAIDFHSRYTGLPYPWPHITAVEGGRIIAGGMEFPMMTLMGDYNVRGDSALYYVTAHELAHMWVPMIVGADEKRHAWMDEGMTTFLEDQARKEWFPGNPSDSLEAEVYLALAGTGREGEVMRWSDYHYSPEAYRVASYAKPATLLVALRRLLGEETFLEAYRVFHAEWAFKHPKPWDFFRTVERVSGRELEWFWRAWYYDTWTLDQGVAEVVQTPRGTRIVVEDRGLVPMPANLLVVREDGETLRLAIPVEVWLSGSRRATAIVPPGSTVVRVEIDPEGDFPDMDRTNNVWTR